MNGILCVLIWVVIVLTVPVYASEVMFSPDGGVRDRIVSLIAKTTGNIDIAMYSFTSKQIADALIKEKSKGRKIRIVLDRKQSRDDKCVLADLNRAGISTKVVAGKHGNKGSMHNKYCVLGRKYVLAGSYNWSNNAEFYNYENMLIIDDSSIINRYAEEFEKNWKNK